LPVKIIQVDIEVAGAKELLELLEKPKDNITKYQKEVDEFKASLRKVKAVMNE
jgi:hypothetical protein